MINVPKSLNLVKIHEFCVQTIPENIATYIEVFEHLNPSSDVSFYAMPVDKPLRIKKPKKKYKLNGTTLDEALNALMAAIEGVEYPDLFEKTEKK